MNEIWGAFKDWLIRQLEPAHCAVCEELRDIIEIERREKDYLRQILFTNARLVQVDVTNATVEDNIRPIARGHSLRARIARAEKFARVSRETEKTEAEKIFENTLKESGG